MFVKNEKKQRLNKCMKTECYRSLPLGEKLRYQSPGGVCVLLLRYFKWFLHNVIITYYASVRNIGWPKNKPLVKSIIESY